MMTVTARLKLHTLSGDDILALIEGVAQGQAQIGLPLADGLREFFVSSDVSAAWVERLRRFRAPDPWIHGFGLMDPEIGEVVGTAGFKGPPDEGGVVEIAYAIAPGHRGRGYATEAAGALVAFAFADERVRVVRAHTLPEVSASTRVLEKCGLLQIAKVVDPEDGPVWRWECVKTAA